jgi:hypothetical protein
MHKLATLITCVILACANAAAADPVRHEKVVLTPHAPVQQLSGKIKGNATVEYSLVVPAGAVLDLRLKGANRSNYFNVFAEGADEALFVGSRDGDHFHATATGGGAYKVQVYLMRNAARRNETASYVLEAGIDAGKREGKGAAGKP